MSTFGAKHLPFSAIINRFNVVTHIVILPAKLSGISIRIGHFLAVNSSEYHVATEQGNFSPKWIETKSAKNEHETFGNLEYYLLRSE